MTRARWFRSPLVSVVIPTKDAGLQFQQTLEAITAQAGDLSYEIIVVDSGSQDDTLRLSRRFGARIVRIPPESFNHGWARNEGLRRARGRYAILLVQDAVPADERWMSALVAALQQDPRVAGAYSRHLGRPDSDYLGRYVAEFWHTHVGGRQVQEITDLAAFQALPGSLQRDRCTFNNVSAIIRRSVWKKHPFPCIAYAEDLAWAKEVLEAGYRLVYEPESRVVHAHERPVSYELRRAYVDARSVARIFSLPDEPLAEAQAQALLQRFEQEPDLIERDLAQAGDGGLAAAVEAYCQHEDWYAALFDNLALRRLFGPASPWPEEDRAYLYAGLDAREAQAQATRAAADEPCPWPGAEGAQVSDETPPGPDVLLLAPPAGADGAPEPPVEAAAPAEPEEAAADGDPAVEPVVGPPTFSQRIAQALAGEDLDSDGLQFVFRALWDGLGRDYARQAVLDSLGDRPQDPVAAAEHEQHAFADAVLQQALAEGALTRPLYRRVRLYSLAWAVGRRLGRASQAAQAEEAPFWQDLTRRWAPGI